MIGDRTWWSHMGLVFSIVSIKVNLYDSVYDTVKLL